LRDRSAVSAMELRCPAASHGGEGRYYNGTAGQSQPAWATLAGQGQSSPGCPARCVVTPHEEVTQ